MQKPIIFLATADLGFERTATDAILNTAHALRRAHTIDEVGLMLDDRDEDIALAVVDGDLRQDGRSAVEILAVRERKYPVLVIQGTASLGASEAGADCERPPLVKPVKEENLRRHIEAVCRLHSP